MTKTAKNILPKILISTACIALFFSLLQPVANALGTTLPPNRIQPPKYIDVCADGDWLIRGSIDLPGGDYRSFDHVVLPDGRLKQSVLSLNGTQLKVRYFTWDAPNKNWVLQQNWVDRSGDLPFSLDSSFRGYDQETFPENESTNEKKFKQTVLSGDGKSLYVRYLIWDIGENNWKEIGEWQTRTSDFPNPGTPYLSYDHTVYPNNSIRQSILSENGKKIHIRYLTDWNGSTWSSINPWKIISAGLPEPSNNWSFTSFDQVVFPDNRIKQTIMEPRQTVWFKYLKWKNCQPTAAAFAKNAVESYSRTLAPGGVYDASTNKTFIVYASGIKDNMSAVDPYIIYYNHQTNSWSDEAEIDVLNLPPDSHYYPQIVIDENRFVHVFHSLHASGEIRHYVSLAPLPNDPTSSVSITNWRKTTVPNTNNHTYLNAFKAKNGAIYLVYRSTDIDPNRDGLRYWYEPIKYVISTDNGESWSSEKILINPPNNNDLTSIPITSKEWGTIYLEKAHYESSPEGLNLLFSLRQTHNTAYRKFYYLFFSFNDNKLYTVDGTDVGQTLDSNEFSSAEFWDYGIEIPFEKGPPRMTLDIDDYGLPHIFMVYIDTGGGKYIRYMARVDWKPKDSQWSQPQVLRELGEIVEPYELKYRSDSNIYVWATKNWETIYAYHYDGANWSAKPIYTDSDPTPAGLHDIAFISDAKPNLMGTFIDGTYSGWNQPSSTGVFYAFADTSAPTPTPKPGDANGDGKVDGLDYIIWLNHYKQTTPNGPSDGDFNGDGKVDGLDYVIWLNNYQ